MRRLVVAAEALTIGRRGQTVVARATGVSRRIMRQGMRELGHPNLGADKGRIRHAGGLRETRVFSTAKDAAVLSLLANATLVALKLGVGLYIGSISVLSDALDSGMDLLGAFVAFFAIRLGSQPADRRHPYGHGKVESLSALVEGTLILVGAALITYEAIHRLRAGVEIEAVGLGIGAMALSLTINAATSFHLLRVARRTGSPALEATAWHRASDILTSFGVLVGLILVLTTPWKFLDAVVALGVAAFVVWTAFRLFGRALRDLLDVGLPETEERSVREALQAYADRFVEYHSLRTRRSGSHRQIDFHLVMPRTVKVGEAHELTDRIEAEIERRLPRSIITIHVEPCEAPQGVCDLECRPGEVPYCHRVPYHSHAQTEPTEPAHRHGP